jgi:hypothetical protein
MTQAEVDALVDIQIDPATGRTVMDTATGDAALVRGVAVVLQDLAIRLRTQIGEIKRQGLDTFGWDIYGMLKREDSLANISLMRNAILSAIREDDRVDDAEIGINNEGSLADKATVFDVTVKIADSVQPPFQLTMPD